VIVVADLTTKCTVVAPNETLVTIGAPLPGVMKLVPETMTWTPPVENPVFGVTVVTVGNGETKVKAVASFAVPPPLVALVVVDNETVPAPCFGETTSIVVVDTTTKLAALVEANVTAVTIGKPVPFVTKCEPVTSMVVPPFVGPVVGVMDVMCGLGASKV
jgi:hypothetical protein